jgi:hypothetical protein
MQTPGPETFFDDTWVVYAHDPNDGDWTHASYKMLGIVSCVDDFWSMWNAVEPLVPRCMLFFMREHVFPSWDDPANIDGCTASVVFPDTQCTSRLLDIPLPAFSERLGSAVGGVNGVSCAPKKFSSVVKLWFPTVVEERDVGVPGVRVAPCRARIAERA